LVAVPPAIEYFPPVMLIGATVLIPEIVIAVEVTFALNAAPVTAVKLNASGVVSANTVVTVNACDIPPTVSTAWFVAPSVADAVRLTTTV